MQQIKVPYRGQADPEQGVSGLEAAHVPPLVQQGKHDFAAGHAVPHRIDDPPVGALAVR